MYSLIETHSKDVGADLFAYCAVYLGFPVAHNAVLDEDVEKTNQTCQLIGMPVLNNLIIRRKPRGKRITLMAYQIKHGFNES